MGKLKDYGTSSSGIAVGIQNIVSDSVIKQFDDLTQKMAGLNEHSKEYQTYLKQYNQLEASLISESEKLANAFGFTGDKTSDARKALIGYLYELRAAKKLHTEEADNINKAADATEDFGNKSASTKDRINALQKQPISRRGCTRSLQPCQGVHAELFREQHQLPRQLRCQDAIVDAEYEYSGTGTLR